MSEYRDLEDMIEVLNIAIARQETEEQFFRRSAKQSTNDASKALFTEIADELKEYVKSLERRRLKFIDLINDLNDKKKMLKTAE